MAEEFGSEEIPVFERVDQFYIKLACTLLLVLMVAAWGCFSFRRRNRKGRLPPGPFPLPIIGNLHLLRDLPHQALAALSLKYGPLMSLRLGSALTLVVSSPDVAKEFLKNHDRVFAGRPPSAAAQHLSYNCSDVAMAPYGPYWRQMLKLCVLQLLSSRRIDSFRFIREEEVAAMIHSISNSNSSPVNITKTVSALGIDIICRMVFGRKYSHQDLTENIKEAFLLAGTFNIGDYVPYLAWLPLQGLKRRFENVHNVLDQFFDSIIEEHIARNEPNATPDLVDVLLAIFADKDKEFQLTRDNIKAVIGDMFTGGSDTSSTSIEWAMSEVLRNPPVMKKLQEELRNPPVMKKLQEELESVVGLDRMVQESDLPSLVYLQAVVNETLRLHPPGPISIPHFSVEDCTVLGYEIPSGTCVLVNLWAIARNPKSWEDAESFRPERFEEASSLDGKVQNLEWIPLGAGRRGCPGQQLGTLVVGFTVAQLLHCFNWRLPEDISGQELDMTERFNGLTVPRAHELWAVPTPRLSVL